MRYAVAFALVQLSVLIGGCGLRVPDVKEVWDGPHGTEEIEFEIKKTVFCDLREAVADVDKMEYFKKDRNAEKYRHADILPDDWGAQVSLSLTVDEVTALNPGISIIKPLENVITHFPSGNVTTGQSSALGVGATLSSTATRTDRFDPYYSIAYLREPATRANVCKPENDPYVRIGEVPAKSSPLITSELGIDDWLTAAMVTNKLIPSRDPELSNNKDIPDTISIEVKFVVVSSGSITPAWKLVRFTANSGNMPFLSAGRTRTHDLIITIGPPNPKTQHTHLAAQIGQAVSSGTAVPLLIQ